jgi:hypothetical protein
MRDNSGSGKGKNNMRDPTMRDHEGENRTGQNEGRDLTEGSAFNIGDNARDGGEKRSPGDRARGETASTDRKTAVDVASS